jgi:hypothetical protein
MRGPEKAHEPKDDDERPRKSQTKGPVSWTAKDLILRIVKLQYTS